MLLISRHHRDVSSDKAIAAAVPREARRIRRNLGRRGELAKPCFAREISRARHDKPDGLVPTRAKGQRFQATAKGLIRRAWPRVPPAASTSSAGRIGSARLGGRRRWRGSARRWRSRRQRSRHSILAGRADGKRVAFEARRDWRRLRSPARGRGGRRGELAKPSFAREISRARHGKPDAPFLRARRDSASKRPQKGSFVERGRGFLRRIDVERRADRARAAGGRRRWRGSA